MLAGAWEASIVIREYIAEALERAHYEIIEDEEPYYGRIPECPGVWATGKTLEECRRNLEDALDGWLYVRMARGLEIPAIGGAAVTPLQRVE